MPRSAHLKNLANGLCGSFASRNNDLDGYWAIGKLRSLAEQHGRNVVDLDILATSMQPPSSGFAPVLARYRRLLMKLAGLSAIRYEEITSARIMVDFAPPPQPRASYYRSEWGSEFVLTVSICADGRADGIMLHAGYCRPHNPASECRSTRSCVGRS